MDTLDREDMDTLDRVKLLPPELADKIMQQVCKRKDFFVLRQNLFRQPCNFGWCS